MAWKYPFSTFWKKPILSIVNFYQQSNNMTLDVLDTVTIHEIHINRPHETGRHVGWPLGIHYSRTAYDPIRVHDSNGCLMEYGFMGFEHVTRYSITPGYRVEGDEQGDYLMVHGPDNTANSVPEAIDLGLLKKIG